MTRFQEALKHVLAEEGGFSNHPKDPGGATMKGVTQRVYDQYRQRNGQAKRTVRDISQTELEDIYRKSYWDLAKCDQLPAGVDFVVFDGAVNSGVGQSAKWLQRALGVNADGVIGPATIGAAKAYSNHAALVDRICDQRLAFLKALKTWPTFGKGWSARVARVRKTGKQLAAGSAKVAAPVKPGVDQGNARAYVSDVKTGPSPATGDALTGAGTFGATVTQTINQLTPMSNVDFVAKIITWLTVVSVLLALAGIGYGIWARYRKAKLKEAAGTAVE